MRINKTKGQIQESEVIKCLIDGDIIKYSVGFAAQGEPVENCLHSVKIMINSMLKNTGSDEYVTYISGDRNFRDEVATIKEYKGTRKGIKPEHYDDIHDYLIKYHNGCIVEDEEADDAMGIAQCREPSNTVICSIDKDMDMIPGWHYHWPHHGKKATMYCVHPEEALKNFYTQLLTGDAVDNIAGCKGVGAKTADKLLNPLTSHEDLFWTTLCQYEKAYPKPYEVMLENARLLWIRRIPREIWEMPY